MERAVGELAARGRRRVGVITTASRHEAVCAWLSRAAESGLEIRPEWVQAVHLDYPAWARNAAQLLMSPELRHRPDGLIITDDNLVPPATAGFAAAGVRVPDDADVIAHTNFPWPTPSALPACRIGYDATAILRTCIGIIDARRAGNDVPAFVAVPAVGEDEVAQSHALARVAT